VGGVVAGVEEDEADASDLGVFWYRGGCLIGLLLIAIVVSYGGITHQQHLKRGNNKGVTTTKEHIKIIVYHCQQQSTKYKYETRIQA
jgi:hypothetical protein